jgi:predicted RNA-binding Zn ribbon-like protein
LDIEAGQDELDDQEALRRWLVERDLLARDILLEEVDVHRAVDVREAFRAMLLANNGSPVEPRPLQVLNELAARRDLVLQFDADGGATLIAGDPGLSGALSRLLGILYRAMLDGTWRRLKACRNDGCSWAFYDRSKNRSGAWCTMADCGNKVKTRSYRKRVRAMQRR